MCKISIIVPCYNAEDFIRETLESIERQTYNNYEVFVIDDASSDGSIEIVKDFINITSINIQLIQNKKNKGVSYSRNIGIKRSNGEYIAFLDSDDTWEPEKLEKQINIFESKGNDEVGVVYTGVNIMSDIQTKSKLLKWEFTVNNTEHWGKCFNSKYTGEITVNRLLHSGNHICLSSSLVKREAISFSNGFDETLPFQIEDYLLWCCISLKYNFFLIQDKLTNYRVHSQSYTLNNFAKKSSIASGNLIKNLLTDRVVSFSKKNRLNTSYFDLREQTALRKVDINYFKRIISKLWKFRKLNYYDGCEIVGDNSMGMKLEEIIIFLTDKCNLACSHCFIDKFDKFDNNEIALNDFKKLLDSIADVKYLLLTGGEPFLNKDIVPIVLYSLKRFSVLINTNGYDTIHIIDSIRKILSYNFDKTLSISISIDGDCELHDNIRRKKGAFQRALDTIRLLEEIKKRDNRISIKVNTTVTENNLRNVNELLETFACNLKLDYHNFEIVRGSVSSNQYFLENKDMLTMTYKLLLKGIKKYYPSAYQITKFRFEKQIDFLLNGKKWDYDCLAGQNNLVVYANGEVAACEMRDRILDLNNYDFNLLNAVGDKKINLEICSIENDKCCCTHGCWLLTSYLPVLREKYYFCDYNTALKYNKIWNILLKSKILLVFVLCILKLANKIKSKIR